MRCVLRVCWTALCSWLGVKKLGEVSYLDDVRRSKVRAHDPDYGHTIIKFLGVATLVEKKVASC
jgi:hypothetical protein